MKILCRMGHHRPSRRSQLDLLDQQVKTHCKSCGIILIRTKEKWHSAEDVKIA